MSAKYLVIVESPAKAKTINKILGKDYLVKASMGHVRDLPEHSLGVDVEHGFEPRYEPMKSRAKVMGELKAAAKGVERVYLAPDPDREGEAIAWHLREMLKGKGGDGRFSRVTYNEITAPAIRAAFEHPGEINLRRVDSQQARRILDRVVGYKVSPYLWQRFRGARSAGRVQSVALRLVCEREAAIRGFVPEAYWVLGVKAAKRVAGASPFTARLWRVNGKKAEVKDEGRAAAMLAELKQRGLRVRDILRKEVQKRAPPPFITSSLQQAASGMLGMSPSRTMRIAQKLYEGVSVGGGAATGLITYMRTDSTAVAATAQEAARRVIEATWGKEYLPARPNVYKNRSSAQEAHEAIRPTDPARTPEQVEGSLEADELKLYTLIWRRFMASQMAPARVGMRTAELEAVREPMPAGADARARAEFLFRATASEVLFPGFMRASGMEKRKKDDADKEGEDGEMVDSLPALDKGEWLDAKEWLSERKETQPPARFTEAALVKALEENGVGRPSTYAQTIQTILDREYVTREKRALVPTELGEQVNAFLVSNLDELFAVPFTAKMEAELDKIEEGGVDWREMLGTFYKQFTAWMAALKGPEAPRGDIEARLKALEGVKEWSAPVKRGNRTYSDEKFVASLREQLEAGERPFSDRQKAALDRMLERYAGQFEGAGELFARLDIGGGGGEAASGGGEAGKGAAAAPDPAEDARVEAKLAALEGVQFEAPHTVGKRTYDDKAFFESLRDQARSGKRLSERQVACIDRMLKRYGVAAAGAEGGGEGAEEGAGAGPERSEEAARQLERVLEWMGGVREWKPAVERKGRTYDDKAFFESLKKQHDGGKTLSDRQVSALMRMARGYAAQMPPEAAEVVGTPRKRGGG
ncbi:MAG: type I DNA topoisomerase [Kiritimatiellae bacterium]|nr:type I DNA topoisomerase [Kiritimatiellia bacterium]